jgi:hypothetical protein
MTMPITNNRTLLALAIVASVAAASVTGLAIAGETTSTKKTSTWSWSFGTTNFGSNQVKGSGVVKEESRAVANFAQLSVGVPAVITVSQGSTESLTISADDNLLPLIDTRVVNGELVIAADNQRGFSTKHPIKIRLSVKNLNVVKINGSGDVLGDEIKGEKFEVAINGSGDVHFKSVVAPVFMVAIRGSGDVSVNSVDANSIETSVVGSGDIKLATVLAQKVNISVRGSGDVQLAGRSDKVVVEIAGSGDVNTRDLVARDVSVKIAASGDARVHATEKLTATVMGSGDVRYAGNPKQVDRTVRGSGSIEAL